MTKQIEKLEKKRTENTEKVNFLKQEIRELENTYQEEIDRISRIDIDDTEERKDQAETIGEIEKNIQAKRNEIEKLCDENSDLYDEILELQENK